MTNVTPYQGLLLILHILHFIPCPNPFVGPVASLFFLLPILKVTGFPAISSLFDLLFLHASCTCVLYVLYHSCIPLQDVSAAGVLRDVLLSYKAKL